MTPRSDLTSCPSGQHTKAATPALDVPLWCKIVDVQAVLHGIKAGDTEITVTGLANNFLPPAQNTEQLLLIMSGVCCVYCGRDLCAALGELTVDHLVPESLFKVPNDSMQGNSLVNLVAACSRCNYLKRDWPRDAKAKDPNQPESPAEPAEYACCRDQHIRDARKLITARRSNANYAQNPKTIALAQALRHLRKIEVQVPDLTVFARLKVILKHGSEAYDVSIPAL